RGGTDCQAGYADLDALRRATKLEANGVAITSGHRAPVRSIELRRFDLAHVPEGEHPAPIQELAAQVLGWTGDPHPRRHLVRTDSHASPAFSAPPPPTRPSPSSGEGKSPAETLPPPRAGGGWGGGAGGQPGSFRPLRHLAPIPAFPRKRGKGKSRPRLSAMPPSPASGGGLGWGQADAIDPTRRLDIARARHARTTPPGRGWGERDWSFALSDVPVTAEV